MKPESGPARSGVTKGRCETKAAGIVVALLTLALTTGCPRAKAGWRVPQASAYWNLQPGSGAQYEASCSWRSQSLLELAVVGKDEVAGHPAYRLEIWAGSPKAPKPLTARLQFLIDGASIQFTRGVVQVPGHPPALLPDSWLFTWGRGALALVSGYVEPYREPVGYLSANPNPQPTNLNDLPADLPRAKQVGTQEVGTPAGAFSSRIWRFGVTGELWRPFARQINAWFSSSAGPFGLVKAEMHDPYGLESDIALARLLTGVRDRMIANPVSVQRNELMDWILEPEDPLLYTCFPELGLPPPPSWVPGAGPVGPALAAGEQPHP